MANDYFEFKQFKVFQSGCAMKVGTDGVLLGSWCDVNQAGNILDIGTGSGLIALMLAQRNSDAIIDAVELDKDACVQALTNFKSSSWSDRLSIQEGSIVDYLPSRQIKYDLIVSNPPFFQNSLKSGDKKRTAARHTCSLPFDALIEKCASLIAPLGKLALVYPIDADVRISELCRLNRFGCLRKTFVRGAAHLPVKRVLAEFVYDNPLLPEMISDELIIELERHKYTPDYIALTRDFYLNM